MTGVYIYILYNIYIYICIHCMKTEVRKFGRMSKKWYGLRLISVVGLNPGISIDVTQLLQSL